MNELPKTQEQKKLECLKRTKKVLMQQLLTGKLRITVEATYTGDIHA